MTKFRYTPLGHRIINWMPFGWDNRDGFYWLGPIEYVRLLWSRARRKREPWPEKPKNRHLVVPIAETMFFCVGDVAHCLEPMTDEQRANAEDLCKLYPAIYKIRNL